MKGCVDSLVGELGLGVIGDCGVRRLVEDE